MSNGQMSNGQMSNGQMSLELSATRGRVIAAIFCPNFSFLVWFLIRNQSWLFT